MSITELGVLYCGDCLEIMPLLTDEIDLVLTDPPYGLDKKLSQGAGKLKNRKSRQMYEGETWDQLQQKAIDYIIERYQYIIWGANYYLMPPSRGLIVWDKLQAWDNFSKVEIAYTSCNKPATIFHHSKSAIPYKQHPTQKPIELIQYCINWTKTKGLVLDSFLGSGTTAVACDKLGIRWIGIEISEKYCEIAKGRIKAEADQMKFRF